MKLSKTSRQCRRSSRHISILGVVVVACIATRMSAQSVIAPLVPPSPAQPGPGATRVVPGARTTSTTAAPVVAPLQFAGFEFRPHVDYRYAFTEGLLVRPGVEEETSVHNLSPGLTANSAHWSADYTPTWTFYSTKTYRDTVAHAANITGSSDFAGGKLRLSDQYNSSDEPQIETGTQTSQHSNITALDGDFPTGPATLLQVGVSQSLRSTAVSPSEREWSGYTVLQYQFTTKLAAGLGLYAGYVDVSSPGIDMSYIRPQLNVSWHPLEKLSFSANVGNERRKFYAKNAETLTTPTFGGAAYYKPLETTSFSFEANRSVGSAYAVNQVTQSTTWTAGMRQRFLSRLNFDAAVGHTQTRYIKTGGVILAQRGDESYLYSAGLHTSVLRRGTVGLTYQRSRNISSLPGYSFTTNQYGFEFGYRY